jgi:hypothetical protein
MGPGPDAKPNMYRITVGDDFATDGPAGADKLRDMVINPGSAGAVHLSDVGKVANLPGPYDGLFLTNYANLRLRDDLSRVPGVGDVNVRGVGAYAMRVWLDPDKLAARQLTTQDVAAALARQNVQVAAGQVGQPPNPSGQVFQMTVTTLGRLTDPAQFEGIVIKSGGAGQIVYLRDVARVELGAQSYDTFNSRTQAVPPAGGRVQHPVRHDQVRRGGDRQRVLDARRGVRPGPVRHPDFPAKLAGPPGPGHHRPGDDHRGVRVHAGPGILGQPAHPVRAGAGHRHCR